MLLLFFTCEEEEEEEAEDETAPFFKTWKHLLLVLILTSFELDGPPTYVRFAFKKSLA